MWRAGGDWIYAREPVLRRMPDGSLVALALSGGPTEPHDDNLVLTVRSGDAGRTWSAPEVLFRHATRGCWATELFVEGDEPFLFVHTLDAASHYLELQTYLSRSPDSGRTWTEPVSLRAAFHNVCVRQGVTLRDGAWLFPVYWQEARGGWDWRKEGKTWLQHPDWRCACGVMISRDRGRTWSTHGRLASDLTLWEPNVVEIAPGRLVMLMRAEGVPVKYRADSEDGGVTWSAPVATDIPDANSKVTLLRHGEAVLMLHNPSAEAGWGKRRSLELWVSHDGCRTWPGRRVLARAVEPDRVMCYPHGFVEPRSGQLHVAMDAMAAHYYMTVPLSDVPG
jgi:predicted neuraminidase